MAIVPLSYLPGVNKNNTPYVNAQASWYNVQRPAMGRITDMQWFRFQGGMPERIPPQNLLDYYNVGTNSPSNIAAVQDTPRQFKEWRDNNGLNYLGLTSPQNIYYTGGTSTAQKVWIDITPLQYLTTGTLTNVFATTSNSSIITVTQNQNLNVGDWIQLSTSTIAGITINNNYAVSSAGTGAYTFNAGSLANATTTATGGTVNYSYPYALATNPFVLTSGSPAVKINYTANGLNLGDSVYWTGGTTFAGVNLTNSGTFGVPVVVTTAGTNSFYANYIAGNLTSTNFGTATANGTGGGTVRFQFAQSFNTPMIPMAGIATIDNYGQQLYSCISGNGIYVFDPSIGGRSYPLYNSPAGVLGMVITAERFVFALGQNSNPMMVAWPDQSNPNQWTALPTNTANSGRTLQKGNYLVTGAVIRDGLVLVFSNTSVYTFSYSGDNNVYDSTLSGEKCGLQGPLAVTVLNNIAYWYNGFDFWNWNGAVQKVTSDDIRDWVRNDIYNAFDSIPSYQPQGYGLQPIQKIVVASNINHNEIWITYPSGIDNIGENSRYVIYHVDQGIFSNGYVGFTAMIDRNLTAYPITGNALGALGQAVQYIPQTMHTFLPGNTDNSAVALLNPYVTYSPVILDKDYKDMGIIKFYPDILVQNIGVFGTSTATDIGAFGINLNVYYQQYPNSAKIIDPNAPFNFTAVTTEISLRGSGKLLSYQIAEGENTPVSSSLNYRLGCPWIEITPQGARI